ncbi:MAG: thiamine pyrophosphate-binding protein [Alphaproteobacteria bacterium]
MVNVARDWGHGAHAALSEAGVRQVPYVPDGGLDTLLHLCEDDNHMRPVLLSSEQEGVGVAAGAWLGGERAALLMQSSGVGNCINALALVRTCGFPLLMIVTMRGEWHEFNPWQLPMGQSAAAHLEQSGVIVQRVEDADKAGEMVAAAAVLAFETMSAVAVVIAQRVIGVKSFAEPPENA